MHVAIECLENQKLSHPTGKVSTQRKRFVDKHKCPDPDSLATRQCSGTDIKICPTKQAANVGGHKYKELPH